MIQIIYCSKLSTYELLMINEQNSKIHRITVSNREAFDGHIIGCFHEGSAAGGILRCIFF